MTKSKLIMKSPTPILRIFNEEKAKEFYLSFLEFNLDWEHRFGDGMPLYMQISYENCIIHLSEHHGDCSPGAAIRIEVENLTLLHSSLTSKNYRYSHPGIETMPWNTQEVTVEDPFANRIVFFENIQK
ncbi:glyoxalase superfamily protein [Halobacillus karajensis]|uniref:Bleomycin resistance protein n=1 Tax=Halobacillus karajensis TaxID=195088 RepID=A0A024P900_9BACI|nr:glyoxalase superfamily protein [Halobacillus karajensis]CDQ21329.1 Glyoxalase-like domain protein [Halobacillus karajensis]CDQ25599.1 Glyoxalase-like domain protein [Halobacillus karajensis]CDQ25868.1 Glyoxalase-like domain protein [Halobacillus karajensis]